MLIDCGIALKKVPPTLYSNNSTIAPQKKQRLIHKTNRTVFGPSISQLGCSALCFGPGKARS